MSLWRWTRISNFSRTAVLVVLLSAMTGPSGTLGTARADNPSSVSSGPTSSQEAVILWQDGKAAFDKGLDEDAIPKLERFVARYPGYPGYFEARHLLGKAQLRQNEPAKARPHLKAFIQAQSRTPEAIQARLELCRADLELELYSEALLTAQEVVHLTRKPEQHQTRAEALILQARAQIGLGQDERASASLQSALKDLPPSPAARLAGEAKDVELELKFRSCAKFPSAGKLEEGQVRDQFARRGSCLLDALLSYREVLGANDSAANDEGQRLVSEAYDAYWLKCQHPPAPPPTHPKNRSAQQLQTYFRELGVVLEEDCRQKIRQGVELLNGWKTSVPAGAQDELKRSAALLEKLK